MVYENPIGSFRGRPEEYVPANQIEMLAINTQMQVITETGES